MQKPGFTVKFPHNYLKGTEHGDVKISEPHKPRLKITPKKADTQKSDMHAHTKVDVTFSDCV